VTEESPSAAGGSRRRPHTARLVAGLVLVVLVVVSVVLATRPSSQASEEASPLLGHRAPPVVGRTLSGASFDLAAYRGRYVYVNFFASWCTPCQTEEPNLVAFDFQQSRQADPAAIVSVVYDDSDASARGFVGTWGARWPAVVDPGGAVANAFGVSSPPTTFLVSPTGQVVGAWLGPVTAAQLTEMLHQVSRGRA